MRVLMRVFLIAILFTLPLLTVAAGSRVISDASIVRSPALAQPASLNYGRSRLAVTTANGKVYAVGGGYPTPIGASEEYDPVTDHWQLRAPLPMPRYSIAAARAVDGRIYAIGGGLDALDLATDQWASRQPLLT